MIVSEIERMRTIAGAAGFVPLPSFEPNGQRTQQGILQTLRAGLRRFALMRVRAAASGPRHNAEWPQDSCCTKYSSPVAIVAKCIISDLVSESIGTPIFMGKSYRLDSGTSNI